MEKGQGWYKLKLSGVDGITNVRGCDLKLAETMGDHQQLSAPASPSPARVRHSATSAKKNKAPSSAKVRLVEYDDRQCRFFFVLR